MRVSLTTSGCPCNWSLSSDAASSVKGVLGGIPLTSQPLPQRGGSPPEIKSRFVHADWLRFFNVYAVIAPNSSDLDSAVVLACSDLSWTSWGDFGGRGDCRA